jgi:hypothetical protein
MLPFDSKAQGSFPISAFGSSCAVVLLLPFMLCGPVGLHALPVFAVSFVFPTSEHP